MASDPNERGVRGEIREELPDGVDAPRGPAQAQPGAESLALLSGGVAHDVNNILAAIVGHAELARAEAREGTTLAHSLDAILERVREGTALTRRLLSYAGRAPFGRQSIDLGTVTERALQLLRPTLPLGARLEAQLERGAPRVIADATQIEQMLLNVLANAVESLPGGRGRVRVHLSGEPPAEAGDDGWVGVGFTGPQAVLVVEDDGEGVSGGALERLFDPWFSTRPGHRGLGLAAVLGVVRAHGGRLRIQPRPGGGTRVLVCLPGAEDPPPDSLRRDPAPPGGLRVLVVDDDPAVRMVFRLSLTRRGHDVLAVDGGEEALAALTATPDGFDVVVLDLTMPCMDGVEALARMRAIRPGLVVLVCSGYAEQEVLDRFTEPPAGFLQKPVLAEELDRRLRELAGAI